MVLHNHISMRTTFTSGYWFGMRDEGDHHSCIVGSWKINQFVFPFLQAFVQNVIRSRGQVESQKDLLDGVLPVLLNIGVPSSVKDVRNIR